MNTAAEAHSDPATRPSPAPSTTGSTGTSGITVRTGPNGQMSFRRWVSSDLFILGLDGWTVFLLARGHFCGVGNM